ncbi:hypothetical protein HMPREF0650_1738 [Hoylesella buccalis ATCC 35310]|uniref:Uncharacterized protein n=1 Tax=Hoylesella buccalis ATCC 35310 TaxID=679190 RepID=D1W5T9_9BACT|nr:hypothetical protein HMPREF0650_1738 [Hoylesella buccalis ATCC 35310]
MLKLNKMKDILDSKGIWLTKQLGKSVCAINCSARNKY